MQDNNCFFLSLKSDLTWSIAVISGQGHLDTSLDLLIRSKDVLLELLMNPCLQAVLNLKLEERFLCVCSTTCIMRYVLNNYLRCCLWLHSTITLLTIGRVHPCTLEMVWSHMVQFQRSFPLSLKYGVLRSSCKKSVLNFIRSPSRAFHASGIAGRQVKINLYNGTRKLNILSVPVCMLPQLT